MANSRWWSLYRLGIVVVVLVVGALPGIVPGRTLAQGGGHIDVFVEINPATGLSNVYFVDALSGLSTVVNASNGENFALVGDYVIYQKQQSGAIMRANLNGTLEPHPFVRRSVDTRSVQWVVSPDQHAMAWVTVSATGETAVFAAWADGSDQRQLPLKAPGSGETLLPLALANDMTRFLYDAAQPISAGTAPFARYERVAEYDFIAGEQDDLPGEPNCPCDAALDPSGRLFARLEAAGGSGPFALHLWDLPTRAEIRIPAPDLPYHYGGDLILNPAGTFAAYAIAAGVGEEADIRPAEYALVLVNIVSTEQYAVLPPGPDRYRPLAFIDDDAALLLADAAGATFKLDLATRDLLRVSNYLYLGTITP